MKRTGMLLATSLDLQPCFYSYCLDLPELDTQGRLTRKQLAQRRLVISGLYFDSEGI